jgi:hypothetical protein
MAKEDADVVFVSNLAVHGFNNGVVNLVFSCAQFLPLVKEEKVIVATADYISANIRMDLFVAQQVVDALNQYLEQNTKQKVMN